LTNKQITGHPWPGKVCKLLDSGRKKGKAFGKNKMRLGRTTFELSIQSKIDYF